jgi:hypothetical protein
VVTEGAVGAEPAAMSTVNSADSVAPEPLLEFDALDEELVEEAFVFETDELLAESAELLVVAALLVVAVQPSLSSTFDCFFAVASDVSSDSNCCSSDSRVNLADLRLAAC